MRPDRSTWDEWFEVSAEELAFLADVDAPMPSPLEHLSPIGAWMRSPDAKAEGARRIEARAAELAAVDRETWEVILRLAAIVGDPDEASILVHDSQADGSVELITCASSIGRAQLAVTPKGAGLRPIRRDVPIAELAASLNEILPDDVAPVLVGLRVARGGAPEGVRWDGHQLLYRTDDGKEGQFVGPRQAAFTRIAAFALFDPDNEEA